jgi:hypothetical protein
VSGGGSELVAFGAAATVLATAAAYVYRDLVPDPRGRIHERLANGLTAIERGDAFAALADFASARRLASREGDLGSLAASLRGLALAHHLNGDVVAAQSALAGADDAARQYRWSRSHARARVMRRRVKRLLRALRGKH